MTIIPTAYYENVKKAVAYHTLQNPGMSQETLRIEIENEIEKDELFIGEPLALKNKNDIIHNRGGRYFLEKMES